ncbi:hypothetical protein LTR49_018026 [Elasticomyces elasticus]|nr:hypothetical protein LTR49_018026 [Elasticomyces elasticus]
MLFATANNLGYQTRKAMKREMYQRAKCLYDNAYEPDQLSLIQSVILLGFWYTDTKDRTEAWHWTGIAISFSQTLGSHRSPESLLDTNRLPERRRRLFRRIWWSCFVRDRWLSLAKGRPMRINPNDCDVPLQSMDDITQELDTLPAATRNRYLPFSPHTVARLWLKLVTISVTLGNILRIHYQHTGPKPSAEEVRRSEEEIQGRALTEEDMQQNNLILQVFAHQLQLFYEYVSGDRYR